MPLIKTLTNSHNTTVTVWKIEESEAWLRTGIELSQNSINRLFTMSSELHRRGFLSIRHLLKAAGYTDFQLHYDDLGKPHLADHRHISITHSFEYTAIVVSDVPTGIDIEKQREKIQRIARKFVGYENDYIKNSQEPVRELTVIWGAKESMYKCLGKKGLGFKEHCEVTDFHLDQSRTLSRTRFENETKEFDTFFHEIDGFTLVYILPIF
jgi:phosphopantetheinyl transferase